MGLAIHKVLNSSYQVVGKNSQNLDATDLDAVTQCIEAEQPTVVVNTIAFMGIDPCEKNPQKALQLNTLLPKHLAELSRIQGFTLIHCSTEAVFSDRHDLEKPYTESSTPAPINMYGYTKLGADYFISAIAKKYYICRLPILFGESIKNNQFVEKMLQRVDNGQEVLRIASDVYSCPTYSLDIAEEIKNMLQNNAPYGLYHLANQGTASLYELMLALKQNLQFKTSVEPASCMDFPSIGSKNLRTPMASEKRQPLRSWQEALSTYCQNREQSR